MPLDTPLREATRVLIQSVALQISGKTMVWAGEGI